MNSEELINILENISSQGARSPGYYLFGEEQYIKRELIGAIKLAAVPSDFAEFNFDEFWGGDLRDPKPFFDTLMAVPMMTGQRLIVLRDAEKAPKELLKSLEDFRIPEGNLLIVESTPRSKSTSFHKKMAAALNSYECTVKNDREMISWVKAMADDRGVEFDKKTAAYLVERAGASLDTLMGELDKLALVSVDKPLTPEDIDRFSAFSRSANIFRFADSFAARDFDETLKIANRLFEFGEAGTMLIAFLKNELFTLLRLKTDPDGAKNVRVPGWKLRYYAEWTRKWKTQQIRNAITALADADIGIKTGRLTEYQAVVEAVASAKSGGC